MRRLRSYILLATVLLACGVVWLQRQAIGDWMVLRSYAPSAEISTLASRTTMTSLGERYLYINRPQLDGRDAFNEHCTNNQEQSVVLGCFLGNRAGIYIFNVTTPELEGVREVTLAHEMLHQAYERLSTTEKTRINTLLQSYYDHGLQDEAIKKQVELYRETEPNALLNEMHSLFGTQVSVLPQALEDYYKRYFDSRQEIAGYYGNYQRAFSERKEKIAAFDAQLAGQKQHIDTLKQELEAQLAALTALRDDMEAKRSAGAIAAYNALVPEYNTAVRSYNSNLQQLQELIDTYNATVAERNSIADQEHALQQSLSSKELPSAPAQ